MDVLAIILACSLHPDDQLIRTLVDVQSSGNRFFVGDLQTLKTNEALRSAEDALRFAEDLRGHGGRPAVGLLGVPLQWAERFGRSPIELFDACTNVAIGTAAFADYYRRCPVQPGSRRSRFHTRRRTEGEKSLIRARYCIVSSFARDLGVSTAAPVILRELIAGTRAHDAALVDAPPERSSPVGGNDAPLDQSAAPSLFLHATPLLRRAPGGRGTSRPGSR